MYYLIARIATQGLFGTMLDRIVSIATQGNFDAFSSREVISLTVSISDRAGGIVIDRRSGGIVIDS